VTYKQQSPTKSNYSLVLHSYVIADYIRSVYNVRVPYKVTKYRRTKAFKSVVSVG